MIRIAVQNDVLHIAEVHVQSWKETYQGMIKQEILDELSVEQRVQLWHQLVDEQNHQLIVYESNGKVAGFLDGYLNPNGKVAEIRAFYFLKDIQGQGIGRKMFEQFYQFIQLKGFQTLRLGVINQNPSRFFYEKMGGKVVGEEAIPEYGENIFEVFYQWDIPQILKGIEKATSA